MTIDISRLASDLKPERTVLLFGSGSSIPSLVPGVKELQEALQSKFGVASTYSLAEQTEIIEIQKNDRRPLIEFLRSLIENKRPTGGILNLPLFTWKSIFTTNYDKLIEISYNRRSRPYVAYSSNFDFGRERPADSTQIFKLHGTIDKDVVDGDRSRIILTSSDYDLTEEYRENLFDRFKSDVGEGDLLVIGHSLADPDIKEVVERAARIRQKAGGQGAITVLSYSPDANLASILERKGITVCFGGLDDLFAALSKRVAPDLLVASTSSSDPLDIVSSLRPATVDVRHSLEIGRPNVAAMFNGWSASYPDVKAGLTFERVVASDAAKALANRKHQIVTILGPSGVGKTTAARQALTILSGQGVFCWEHKTDQQLSAKDWRKVAGILEKEGKQGCLLIDDAHSELTEINDLIDYLVTDKVTVLSLILTSSKNQWYPRVKTPGFHNRSREYQFNRINEIEVDRLLDLLDRVPEISRLVGDAFTGFTRSERKQRLISRCDADMFVCLKNIFSSDQFDSIVLKEYADLSREAQDVYRAVAAMESAGVRVHRQLVIRLLGIPSMSIAPTLAGLQDIVHEYTVNQREGVYGWRGRHRVIMNIIAEHKYYSVDKRYDLFERVIDNLSPSYDIEVRTINELCNVDTGLSTIPDKRRQNALLRKMMSVAPHERVPRQRLIRNLISLDDYDAASTEIRVFDADFRLDGPTTRYSIDLQVARATKTAGILDEDRIAILQKACEAAAAAASRFKDNKAVIGAYCEAALHLARLGGDRQFFDDAIRALRAAELKTGDRHITSMISRFENMISRLDVEIPDGEDLDDVVPEIVD